MRKSLLELLEETYDEYHIVIVDEPTRYLARGDGVNRTTTGDGETINIRFYRADEKGFIDKSVFLRIVPASPFIEMIMMDSSGTETERAKMGGTIYHPKTEMQSFYSEESMDKFIDILILFEDKFKINLADRIDRKWVS